MKIFFVLLTFTTIFYSFPGSYSGMYFDDGLTVFGKYITQEEDGNQTSGLGFGFSYLMPQKTINDLDRPTLLNNGTIEMSGLYTRVDDDDLYMDLMSKGLI